MSYTNVNIFMREANKAIKAWQIDCQTIYKLSKITVNWLFYTPSKFSICHGDILILRRKKTTSIIRLKSFFIQFLAAQLWGNFVWFSVFMVFNIKHYITVIKPLNTCPHLVLKKPEKHNPTKKTSYLLCLADLGEARDCFTNKILYKFFSSRINKLSAIA